MMWIEKRNEEGGTLMMVMVMIMMGIFLLDRHDQSVRWASHYECGCTWGMDMYMNGKERTAPCREDIRQALTRDNDGEL